MNWLRFWREPRRRRTFFLAAASSLVVFGGLVASAALAQYNVHPTAHKILAISLVSFVNIWSCLERVVLLRQEGWMNSRMKVCVYCILAMSILPLLHWATLVLLDWAKLPMDYENLLVVSLC
jgi:hypothetical protein